MEKGGGGERKSCTYRPLWHPKKPRNTTIGNTNTQVYGRDKTAETENRISVIDWRLNCVPTQFKKNKKQCFTECYHHIADS